MLKKYLMGSSQCPLKQKMLGQCIVSTDGTTIPIVKLMKYFCTPVGKGLLFLSSHPQNHYFNYSFSN